MDFPIERAWLDVEQRTGAPAPAKAVDEIAVAIRECQKFFPAGVYTAKYCWNDITGASTVFKRLPLWNAYYDDDPDWDFQANPYGGWEYAEMEQFSENVKLCGVTTDLDVYQVPA